MSQRSAAAHARLAGLALAALVMQVELGGAQDRGGSGFVEDPGHYLIC